ncbi:hypothetical protein TNCT_348931 [Trichonephila clavata]|uniref:Uncharacterized protein n=1 Tax=Trichonephila clavata TaxID=2740835 RepID=A0A8X6FPR2_TRICU|nr:hypothetical protein TNCT_348931 [Trichonephila clavata]
MASPNFQVTINADPTMAMQGMQAMQQTQVGGYTAAPGMIQQPPEGKAPILKLSSFNVQEVSDLVLVPFSDCCERFQLPIST